MEVKGGSVEETLNSHNTAKFSHQRTEIQAFVRKATEFLTANHCALAQLTPSDSKKRTVRKKISRKRKMNGVW